MTALGALIVILAYVAFFVGAFNVALDWWHDRERRRMGLGCWLFQIGVIRKP